MSRAVTAFAAGAAMGAAGTVAMALLLYDTPGLLRATGFVGALGLVSVAAGIWSGATARGLRRRGFIAVGAHVVAAVFALFWTGGQGLQSAPLGPPLAAVVLLAEPLYATASFLVALRGRDAAVVGTFGAAAGVVLGTTVLIPHLPAATAFLGTAAVLSAGLLWVTTATGMRTMDGKRAIVTGVGREGQVGYAVARALLDRGARVVITDRKDGVEGLARSLSGDGRAVGVVADLSRPEEADRVVATARDRFGGVDLLVNAVGGLHLIKPVAETDPEEWAREVDANLRTTFLMSRAALDELREAGGAIVNFASPAGDRAQPSMAAYSAGKAGVMALTRSLALEEDGRVRVNAVAPGMIDTAQNRRSVDDPGGTDFVELDEIVNVVLFLAGEAGAGINGEVVKVLGKTLG